MTDERYTFAVTVPGDVDAVEARVREALADEGFGVLTEIDVAATMKAKLDHDMAAYRILGACNPPLARDGLAADPRLGALLPCNVVVRDVGGGDVEVAFADPDAMRELAGGPGVAAVAAEARERLQRVAAALAG